MSSKDDGVRTLEADIARTREAISVDVDALSQQLNPDRYKAQVQAQTQETLKSAQDAVMSGVQEAAESMVGKSREVGSALIVTLRNHPVPVTLVGLGVALLAVGGGTRHPADDAQKQINDSNETFGDAKGSYGREGYVQPDPGARSGHISGLEPDLSGASNRSYGVRNRDGDRYRAVDVDNAGGAVDAAFDGRLDSALESDYDAALVIGGSGEGPIGGSYVEGDLFGSALAGRVGDAYPQAQRGTRRHTRRRGRGLATFIEEHPLVSGIVTVLAGAAVGLALPGTREEDRLLGDAKQTLEGQTQTAAQRAQKLTQQTFDEARETR